MALVFRGNVTGTATSQEQSLPMTITSFSLVNNDGGANTVTVKVGDVLIYSDSISSGDMYESLRQILVQPLDLIEVSSSASLDFYFTMFNSND